MLELRPTCEHCNKALPPSSLEARICTFECTFCETCVTELLDNVCPMPPNPAIAADLHRHGPAKLPGSSSAPRGRPMAAAHGQR